MPEMWQCTAVRILCGKEGRREEILTYNITPASILHAHKNAHHNHIHFSRNHFQHKENTKCESCIPCLREKFGIESFYYSQPTKLCKGIAKHLTQKPNASTYNSREGPHQSFKSHSQVIQIKKSLNCKLRKATKAQTFLGQNGV